MNSRMTDEMLMAYVDGELDAAGAADVRRALQSDPALAREAESFRLSRNLAREAFSAVKSEPVPEHLIAAVLGSANTNTALSRWATRAALPLVACIALVAGLVGYWAAMPNASVEGDPFGSRAVALALGETASGTERTIRTASGEMRLRTTGTYRVEHGICRSYQLSNAAMDGTVRGVGCNRGSGWYVDIAVAAGDESAITPASGGASAALEAYLDSIEAEGPLSAEEEAALTKPR
jgi:hypothetical protein